MKKKAGIILVVLLVCLLSTVIVACENTIYYTVTFETNGGSQVQEISVNPGDSIASPTSTKEGYVLEGWYDNAEFNGEKITFPYVPNKDTKLYAKWSIESYVGTYVGLVSYVDEEYSEYIGLVPHVYEIFIMTLNEDGTGKFVGAGSDFEVGFSHYYGREFDAKYAIDGGKISIEVTKSLDFRPEVFYLNGSVKNGVITLSELSSFSNDNFTNVVFNRINSDNQAFLGTYSDIVPEGLLEEGIVKLHVALDADSKVKYLYESATGEIGSDEDDTDMQYLIVGDTILLLRDFGDRISITRGIFVDGAITMYGGLWQFVFTRNLSGGTVCETGKHEFGRWIVSQSAFCVTEGVERRACKVCGIKESKTIPPTGVHSSYYSSNDEEHRYVCFHCDYVDVEKSGKHNYGNEIVEQEPTCGYMGRGYRECGVCEHRIYFDIPATGEHTCIDEYDDYRHWQYCSICHKTINGADHEFLDKNDSTGHRQECSGCEYVSKTIPHTLDYAYDANAHWSKCEDCDYVVDKTAHTMTEKSDVNNHWTECTVCNYKSAKIVHTYENRYDSDNHWEGCSGCSYLNNKKAHVLTLTNSETEHWHQCSECSYKSEIETHAFEEAYDKSNHWQQCSVCAYVKDKTAHTTLSIRHDDTYHWRGCDDCEYTEDQQAYNKYATWGKNDEEHWQHCSVCSQEINRSTHGNFRITHERERGLHNELCGTCGINAGLQVDCFSNEWKASDKSHFNTCDYCNEFVKLEHKFDIFVAIGIDKCGCGEFKCNENLQYKLINDNTEYSVSYDKTAETELITLILPDYYEDPVTGEILPVTRIEANGFTGLEISEFFISPSIKFIQGAAFSGSKIITLFIEDMNAWCNMSYSFYGNSLLPVVDNIYYDMKYANDLVIPDGIININYCAFEGFKGLKSVAIPDSVTKIGEGAFKGCSGLTSITIPDSVTRIGEGAFTGCKGLESITLPFIGGTREDVYKKHFGYIFGAYSYRENYTYVPASLRAVAITSANVIDERAFYECSGLTSIVIGNSVTTIGERAFEGCSGLEIITLPFIGATKDGTGSTHFGYIFGADSSSYNNNDYVPASLKTVVITSATAIGNSAFWKCSGLTSITIPDSVTTIDSYAFSGCSGLTSITIPDSVTAIGREAFEGCSGLESITLPFIGATKDGTENTHFDYIFGSSSSSIPTTLKTVVITSATAIGNSAFWNCSGLTSITIPASVITIGENAFWNCSGLTSITIPSSVTIIGWGAFSGCSGLTSVIIPDSVTSIGERAFSGCSGLTSITIPDSVTTIGFGAFEGCSGLESITLPFIGATKDGTGSTHFGYIFCANSSSYNNTYVPASLKTVVITSATAIGNDAFWNCSGLTSVTIPDSVTTIGNIAFAGCSGLTSITIPESVTSIGEGAFSSCSGLERITLPFIGATKDGTGSTHFGYIFGANSSSNNNDYVPASLKTVEITSATAIGKNAFYNCSGLTSISIPASVTTIGDRVFQDCSELESIVVSDSNPKYHSNGNCIIEKESKTLVVGCKTSVIPSDGSVTTIGDYAFSSCSGLTSITIPDSVTTIGDYAFSGCSGLTRVIIGNSVTRIGENAFYGCSGLTSITIPDSVTTIGSSAFSGCSGLTSITIPDSVTTISRGAFYGCSGLESITLPFVGANKDGTGNTHFYYIFGGSSSVPTTLKTVEITSASIIDEHAFNSCSGLTSVVIVGSGVTTIGSSAFYNCSGLTSVVIGNGVTTIGGGAFYGCSELTSITISDSVTTIGWNAFDGCSELTNITIPDSVTTIGSGAFRNCSGLESITLPFIGATKDGTEYRSFGYIFAAYTNNNDYVPASLKTVVITSATAIGDWAFRDCSGLTSITIPESVTTIGWNAFYGCSGLESIVVAESNTNYHSNGNCIIETESKTLLVGFKISVIPSDGSVTTIGDRAFYGCSGLTSITIPDSVTTIGSGAFYGCSGLESITLPFIGATKDGTGSTLFGYIFGADSSSYNNDYVPASLKTVMITSATTIGSGAFYKCSGLTSITIPESVTTIGENAFYKCSGLTSITIPDSVTTIGDRAFSGCSGLTSVVIGNSVTTIGYEAFAGCSGLTSVIIPDSVTSIGERAFSGCSGLTSITIPESVTTIGGGAFNGCSELESITLPFIGATKEGTDNTHFGYIFGDSSSWNNGGYVPASLKTVVITSATAIGDRAFRNCSGLTNITIPEGVTTIGESAFSGCSGLTSITIPDSVITIGNIAFSGCSKLTSITIPDSVTTIGERAFEVCRGLESITLPFIGEAKDGTGNTSFYYIFGWSSTDVPTTLKTVVITSATAIGDRAFRNCSGLTNITIPEGVTTIGESAFSGCSGLTSITIPDSVTTIGSSAFSGCSGLTSITIPDSVTTIGDYAFSGCSGLTSITIPDSVTSIGSSAFSSCSGLTSITIPDSVTTISEWAFNGCIGLTSITIPDSVTTIGDYAFSGCSGLTSITIPDSVTTIGLGAFRNCSGLESITLPFIGATKDGTGSTIFGYIFGDSSSWNNGGYVPASLKTVEITSATAIGSYAFYGCSGLTSITIPDSVTTIVSYAFWNCSGLESITLPFIGATKDGTGSTIFGYIFGTNSNIYNNDYVPASLKTVVITSATAIGDWAFRDCSGLTSITIPESVTTIGFGAFYGCSGLESIIVAESNPKYHSDGNCIIETESKTLVVGFKISVIPSDGSVTTIGERAFSGCSGLTSITIPDSVTTIGSGAFDGCRGLTSITLPFIGATKDGTENTHFDYIFGGYPSSIPTTLKTVVITSTTTIGSSAFSGCSGLTSIIIGNGVTTIGENAFSGCSGLTSIIIGNGVTTIGENAFSGCSGLTSINIPDSVTTIGSYVFSGCSGLTSIIIGNGVTTIGSSAFWNCSGLTSIAIPDSVTTIGESAFRDCSGLTSITIPESVTTIGLYAFYSCSGLESIIVAESNPKYHSDGNCIIETERKTLVLGCKTSVIPTDGSVTTIGSYAFWNCSGLTSIAIPDSVTEISNYAFYECSGLTRVVIGNGVTTIGGNAFSGCSGLMNITVADSNPKYHSDGNCIIETERKTLVLGCKTSVIPSDGSVTTIGDYAFRKCSGLTSITIPESVTTIGGSAFSGCSGLTSITIPDSVTTIGESAFRDCSGLTSIIYNGTMAEWQNISKDSYWNNNTGDYTIICTDGNLSKNN